MNEKLEKVGTWISHNVKLVMFFVASLLFVVFVLWWGYRNKQINSMRNQIAVLESKLKLEKLAMKYNVNVSEINSVALQEKEVEKAIAKIKSELAVTLSSSMSVEEISAKFKEIGVRVDES